MTSRQVSSRPRSPILPIVLWALVTLILMAALTYGITAFLAATSGKTTFWTAHEHPQLTSLLRAAIPAAGLLAAAAAGAVGFLRQRTQEEAHTLELSRHDAELVARLRERYSAGAEQLGHDSVAVRLAGVYALAALADDWIARNDRAEAQVCIDLLCAYLRVPGPPSDENPDGSPSVAHQSELEVRQTITRVISAHLQDPENPKSWCGLDFDFTGVTFEGRHSFAGSHFLDGGIAKFVRALFESGEVSFNGAQFIGGEVDFTGAQFIGGEVNFHIAVFGGSTVDFTSAWLRKGSLSFGSAEFEGGRVKFVRSKFRGAWVDFNHAKFTGGRVLFTLATFEDTRVEFEGAYFTGGVLAFRRAKFIEEGHMDFSRAEFNGSTVEFDHADLLGGHLHLDRSRFLGGQVTFNGTRVHEGEVTFTDAEFTNSEALHLPEGVQLDPTTGTTQWPAPPELTPEENRLREQPDLFY